MTFRKSIASACLALAAFAGGVSQAQAKDLNNRLGIGYKNQFASEVPSLAVQYYPGPDLGVSASLGVDTAKNNSKFGGMAKLYRIIFKEDNVNFYMGAGAGVVTIETLGQSNSGFELMAFGGCEFFFEKLENLGFSVEFGTAVTSTNDGVRFRTFGDFPTRAGVIFYF